MKVNTTKFHDIAIRLISNKMSLLCEGPHGCAKTAILLEVVKELNLKLKYFSASTLDPFADLVGIPFPVTEGDKRSLVYHRHTSIMEAEVLFFDEMNRAHEKVTNAMMEIIQFGTINGDPLPNLICVVAAINPPGGDYHTNEIDPAVMDRFNAYIEVDGKPCAEWFKKTYNTYGEAAIDWWKLDLSKPEKALISPRTLEHIIQLCKIGIKPKGMFKQLDSVPFVLFEKRLKDLKNPQPDIDDFIKDTDMYQELILNNMSTITRFAQLVNVMSTDEMYKCKDYFLLMPPESMCSILSTNEKKFNKLKQQIILNDGKKEAEAFVEMLTERIQNAR